MSYTELILDNLKETINDRNELIEKYQIDIERYRDSIKLLFHTILHYP